MAKSSFLPLFLLSWLVFTPATSCFSASNSSEKLPATHFRTTLQPSDLFDRIAGTVDSIRDLSAQVDFHVRLHNLGLTFNVGGNVYYKKPDKGMLKLRDIPDFLFQREANAFKTTNLLADLQRDSTWRYETRIVNKAPVDGEDCYVVQLVPKNEEGISRILLWVNAANYTMPRVIIHYEDGSNLMQQKVYGKEENVYVVESIESDFNAENVKAEVLTTFRNYQINKGVSEKVFDFSTAQNNPIRLF